MLLAGCVTVGPDYSPPPAATPASFGETPAGVGPGAVEAMWWRAFEEPALEALIRQALTANHDVGIAAARVAEARALLREARREHLPTGGASASDEQRRLGAVERPAGAPSETETYRVAVDAQWEIDLFGRLRRSTEAAVAEAGSREALLRGVRAGVAAEVAATWFELRGIEAELAVVDEITRRQSESLRVVERLQAAGSANELDRLRAEALLRNVEAATPELVRRQAAAVNALAVLVGETPQGFRPPKPTPPSGAPALRTIAVGQPADLLARRPDVAAAERQLAAATARIGVATADLYPQVQVRGSIGLLSGRLDALGDGGTESWFISPVLRWALLDTGRVRARIAASEARAKAALLAYDQTVLRALRETDDAFKAYGASGDMLRLRVQEAAASGEAARLARLRFAGGEGAYLEVLDAERSDFASLRSLAVARTNHRLAVVSIHKALGGGWDVCAESRKCSGAEEIAR
ncbi:TolC family protein [Phenylobacterium sp. 58.2.17]|nr:TolC family protein [Phenylobacterium sp. 58.2.17]